MDRNVELFLNIEKALKEVIFITTHRNENLLILMIMLIQFSRCCNFKSCIKKNLIFIKLCIGSKLDPA